MSVLDRLGMPASNSSESSDAFRSDVCSSALPRLCSAAAFSSLRRSCKLNAQFAAFSLAFRDESFELRHLVSQPGFGREWTGVAGCNPGKPTSKREGPLFRLSACIFQKGQAVFGMAPSICPDVVAFEHRFRPVARDLHHNVAWNACPDHVACRGPAGVVDVLSCRKPQPVHLQCRTAPASPDD